MAKHKLSHKEEVEGGKHSHHHKHSHHMHKAAKGHHHHEHDHEHHHSKPASKKHAVKAKTARKK